MAAGMLCSLPILHMQQLLLKYHFQIKCHSAFMELAQGFGLVNSRMNLPNSECFIVHTMIMQYG